MSSAKSRSVYASWPNTTPFIPLATGGVGGCERPANVLGHYGGHPRPQVADRGTPSIMDKRVAPDKEGAADKQCLGEGKHWFQTGGLWTPAQPLQASPDRRRETLDSKFPWNRAAAESLPHSWRSIHSIWPNGFCGEYTVLEHPGRGLWDCACVSRANHQVYQLRGPLAPPLLPEMNNEYNFNEKLQNWLDIAVARQAQSKS